nr:Cna B-type domain-containing protein [Streptococcus gallolyticus]
MIKLRKILIALLLLFSSIFSARTVLADNAKELTNVITDIAIWDTSNGRYATQSGGVYQLTENVSYSFEVDFDLSAYDGNLANGDYFTFTIPEPFTVASTSFELTDEESGVAVGEAVVISNGEGLGATVTITLKNLEEYLEKTGGTEVQGVQGTFYTNFSVTEVITEETVTFDTTETTDTITHTIKVSERTSTDYSSVIGKTNFSKINGVLRAKSWTSEALGKSGEYVHPFTVRVNERQASYDTIVVHDYISEDYAPAQFIPETLAINASYYNSNFGFVYPFTRLVEGVDYTIEWNSSYTDFVVTILNASTRLAANGQPAACQITYDTTAPANGTRIANYLEVTADGQELTNTTDSTNKRVIAVRDSKVTSGGTIQLDTGYRITLYKQDAETGNLISGAEFEITSPSGNTETVVIGDDGYAQSQVYSAEEVAKGNFTVVETKAPYGYELDSTPIEVTVGESGAIRTIKNSKYTTTANISATKQLTGRELKADEFKFTLTDSDGNVVGTAKNDASGNIAFDELTFDEAGTYTYTITETNGNLGGVTYDDSTIKATVTVTADENDNGRLSATVTYDNNDNTFENTYVPTPTTATLAATKALSGRALTADEFEFTLKDSEGNTVETVKNTLAGVVTFSPITYDKVGTYAYTITETNGGTTVDGVTYDDMAITATVSVVDDGTGNLTATVTYSDDTEFNNKYEANEASATLEVTKSLSGRELTAGEFEFTLKDSDDNVVETVTNDANGTVTFAPITYNVAGTYAYTITETNGGEIIDGITYDALTVTATVEVADNGKGELQATVTYSDDTEFNNIYTPAGETTATIGATKVLDGATLTAGQFSFVLTDENGTEIETVTNAADGSITFTPITYDESQVGTHKYTIAEVAGTATGISYDTTIQEVEVTVEKISATELTATVSKTANGVVFTNTYTPAKTEVKVTKNWDDANNQDGKRPDSITVALMADGIDTGQTLELSEANSWSGSFTDLDADKGGVAIDYQVVETTAVDGYTTSTSGTATDGFTITNSYTPETVDVKATKNWDDGDNQDGKRPTSITINLLADGEKVASKEVTAADDGTWTAEFTNLAKYKDGKEITYTITEDSVTEYETTITDFDIINKYTPKAIEYQVTKVWDDNNDQDGKRPDSVTVQLYKSVNGSTPVAVEGKTLTITADDKTDDNTWIASFTNLPQFEKGQEITYSVQETDVADGYTASVSGQMITNSHTPDTVVISGTKVWDDNNNQDGKRTATVTVQILKGETVVDEIEVSESDDWSFTSKELPKYENGQEIVYSVVEDEVDDYTSQPTGMNVTNSHEPEITSVSGGKTWSDNDDQDGIRPDSITIELLANGESTGNTQTVSADTNWEYTFKDVPKYENGQEVTYTVREVNIPDGYTSSVDGTTITNTHVPETTEVSGTKTWNDNDDQDGKRPDSITVNLLANGTVVDTKTVTADDNWSYSFTDLPKYDNGTEITYTVIEDTVANYTPSYNGYNITNSYTPGQTSITVTKVWDDNNDQDGIRPDAIQVQLYANGEKSGDVITLTAADNWTYTWTGLAEKANKKAITYTVEEVSAVEGYTATVGDVENGNVTITNTHTPTTPDKPSSDEPTTPSQSNKKS